MQVLTGREPPTLTFCIRSEDDRLSSDPCKTFTSFERSSLPWENHRAVEAPVVRATESGLYKDSCEVGAPELKVVASSFPLGFLSQEKVVLAMRRWPALWAPSIFLRVFTFSLWYLCILW